MTAQRDVTAANTMSSVANIALTATAAWVFLGIPSVCRNRPHLRYSRRVHHGAKAIAGKSGECSLEVTGTSNRQVASFPRVDHFTYDRFMDKHGRPETVHETLPDAFAALDYLESVPGIDEARIGLLGFSWGGAVGMSRGSAYNEALNVMKLFGNHAGFLTGMAQLLGTLYGQNRLAARYRELAWLRTSQLNHCHY
ncbi:MAG: dienelactone hydrolase family protein [Gammaproteobacteria bacterium]|nr:dienelactone hydrolase family protein [Gammaproteobacteria bacterium]